MVDNIGKWAEAESLIMPLFTGAYKAIAFFPPPPGRDSQHICIPVDCRLDFVLLPSSILLKTHVHV